MHILDMAENSMQAGADHILISLKKEDSCGLLNVCLKDNGRGMSQEEKEHSLDPFFTSRTTRKVGLGIPLIRQHAEMTGGSVKIVSEEKYGEILGIHMIGDHVTEMISGATGYLNLECTIDELSNIIHPHPTMSEAIMEASHVTEGMPVHI